MKLLEFKDKKTWMVRREIPYQKWIICNIRPLPLDVVQKYELCHIGKGRETKIRKARSTAPDGRDGYILWSLKTKHKQRIEFATTEECEKKGVEPGPYNLFSAHESNKQRRKNRNVRIRHVAEHVRLIASGLGWSVVGITDTKAVEYMHDGSDKVVIIKVNSKDTHRTGIVADKTFLSVGTKTDWEQVVRDFLQDEPK